MQEELQSFKEIDITKVIGTGPNGRIIKRDLEDYNDLSASNSTKHTFNEEDNKALKNYQILEKL